MSSVNQEFSRRVKEEKILRRQKKEGIQPVVEPVVKKEETVLVRARNADGTLKGDDKSTLNVNEAWVEKPKKKKAGRPRKKV